MPLFLPVSSCSWKIANSHRFFGQNHHFPIYPLRRVELLHLYHFHIVLCNCCVSIQLVFLMYNVLMMPGVLNRVEVSTVQEDIPSVTSVSAPGGSHDHHFISSALDNCSFAMIINLRGTTAHQRFRCNEKGSPHQRDMISCIFNCILSFVI